MLTWFIYAYFGSRLHQGFGKSSQPTHPAFTLGRRMHASLKPIVGGIWILAIESDLVVVVGLSHCDWRCPANSIVSWQPWLAGHVWQYKVRALWWALIARRSVIGRVRGMFFKPNVYVQFNVTLVEGFLSWPKSHWHHTQIMVHVFTYVFHHDTPHTKLSS